MKKVTRDTGLVAAIAAAGGVTPLARLLKICQPSVSGWRRVPPLRVLEVERKTGISRRILRPDLYDAPEQIDDAHVISSPKAYPSQEELGAPGD